MFYNIYVWIVFEFLLSGYGVVFLLRKNLNDRFYIS